jgi:hypothetical protein
MTKVELVEMARTQLGMTLATANTKTVVVLRELLRASKAQTEEILDPLAKIPKGLDQMVKAALESEMEFRNLEVRDKMTRPQMILAIRDQVEERKLLSRSAASRGDLSESEAMDESEWSAVSRIRTAIHTPRR